MRDKLIELLLEVDSVCEVGECSECSAEGCYIHRAADYLIAHGVTFAKDNNVPCKCGGEERFAGVNRTSPMTNGDRIRAMSDEELAKVISDGGCPPKISEIVCDTIDNCYVCWSNWLKQPAEEDNEHR